MVLYRGNDLVLEGQDTNSEARDIYKYIIFIYICKSQRIFCFHIQLAFFLLLCKEIYIHIYFSFFLLQCKQGGLNQKLAETASRYFQNPFKEFTDSLSASPFVFSFSLLIFLSVCLYFFLLGFKGLCACAYIFEPRQSQRVSKNIVALYCF